MPHERSWQDSVLDEFTPGLSPVTVVSDPDGLLRNEGLLAALRERRFALLPFEDPVAFRYAYESHYRPLLRSADAAGLVVCVAGPPPALNDLPYDIPHKGPSRVAQFGGAVPSAGSSGVAHVGPARLGKRSTSLRPRFTPTRGPRRIRDQGFRLATRLRHPAGTVVFGGGVAGGPLASSLSRSAHTNNSERAHRSSPPRTVPRLAARTHRAGSRGVPRLPARALADLLERPG